ncbi:hypothetical protein, partial [Xanthovirga aplysinae]|uniref:hypothetical protein n=1 Tax=Xanthovirga aplysinae TaxID=2529853 RepID=UPI0012BC5AFE
MTSQPLTKVLLKIFAKGFYKVHSGLLVFFFVSILTYCFYIDVLNGGHFSDDELLFYHLLVTLTLVSSPILAALVFFFWLIYTFKSWKYVLGQISQVNNQFLVYSSTAFNKIHQFKSWFIVQFVISLPFVCFGFFSIAIGLIFHHYFIPLVILLFIFFIILISAGVYVGFINRLASPDRFSLFIKNTFHWRKPFFSLFIYHVLHQLKLSYGITKSISLFIILGGYYHFFGEEVPDLRVGGILMLFIMIGHSFLIYQSHVFEIT